MGIKGGYGMVLYGSRQFVVWELTGRDGRLLSKEEELYGMKLYQDEDKSEPCKIPLSTPYVKDTTSAVNGHLLWEVEDRLWFTSTNTRFIPR